VTRFPRLDRSSVPHLKTVQMIEVDRAMIEDYGIVLIQMMENAGRALALTARERFLGGDTRGKSVIVLAGTGGNGGGALVAARRLKAWGAEVRVLLSAAPDALTDVPAHQLAAVKAMGVPVLDGPADAGAADLVLDGVIGYSLSGAPYGRAAALIGWANGQGAPVLSLDAPSGLDAASGQAFDPSITAAATLTLALPKTGLDHPQVGALLLADISVPPDLYERFLNLEVGPIFAPGDIVELV